MFFANCNFLFFAEIFFERKSLQKHSIEMKNMSLDGQLSVESEYGLKPVILVALGCETKWVI